jgi:hypothetical protein
MFDEDITARGRELGCGNLTTVRGVFALDVMRNIAVDNHLGAPFKGS